MHKIKEAFAILTNDDFANAKDDCRTQFFASLVFTVAPMLMLIQNIKNQSWPMANATVVLIIGFGLNMIVAGVMKNKELSSFVIMLLVSVILTVFTLSGGNEGFAILWTMLVPVCSISLLGIRNGILISTYFLILFYVVFYTPIRASMVDKYTTAMIGRYPILYTSDYVIALFLSLQKEYYSRKLQIRAYMDELTGVFNRNWLIHQLEEFHSTYNANLNIAVIDINGLKYMNDNFGHDAGDKLIIDMADALKNTFGKDGQIARMGGDEFALISQLSKDAMASLMDKLLTCKHTGDHDLNFSTGWVSHEEFPLASPMELLKIADARMYIDKQEFYKAHPEKRGT
ncbi:MAG: GGDEF domain-containing protein [Erysipelotrichaceae bacterium]|nr:GGDEF domain-containing protein [Erysipelotrichaceae bacterium]